MWIARKYIFFYHFSCIMLFFRFETLYSTNIEEPNYLVPKDVDKYLSNIGSSKFIECNHSGAAIFRSKFRTDKSPEALRFRHKVWKMLSRVKMVFESLNIVFWLSSGTLLGKYKKYLLFNFIKKIQTLNSAVYCTFTQHHTTWNKTWLQFLLISQCPSMFLVSELFFWSEA